MMKSYSQCGQDVFLQETLFKNKNNGVFVDIGAHDGISFSNTKMFEDMGWDGICVEPIPSIFKELQKNRKCKCWHGAVSDKSDLTVDFLYVEGASNMLSGIADEYDPRHVDRIALESKMYNCHPHKITVPNLRFNETIDLYEIDLLCIDTEGNELKILKSIDFTKYTISAIVVENNYNDDQIPEFLQSSGYEMIKILEGDQVFVKPGCF
jgi:FkbM family methyltransferase